MKYLILIIVFCFQSHAAENFSKTLDHFLIPRTSTAVDTAFWELKPTVQVPALKLRESTRPNAKLDVTAFSSAGAGITFQRTIRKAEKNYATISASLIAMFSATTSPSSLANFGIGITGGLFNNLLQAGIGWDAGEVPDGKRFFGMLSLGINLTNN